MARYDHLPLFKTAYKLCLEVYKITKDFSREYKYTLGEQIKETSHEILDLVIETNSLEDKNKGKNLTLLLLKTEKLRMYLRISCDLKILSASLLGKMALQLEEIGKQAAGWQKWSNIEHPPKFFGNSGS